MQEAQFYFLGFILYPEVNTASNNEQLNFQLTHPGIQFVVHYKMPLITFRKLFSLIYNCMNNMLVPAYISVNTRYRKFYLLHTFLFPT